MKVIQLTTRLNQGSVARATLEVAQALVKQGHQSIVISSGGVLVTQLEQEGSQHFLLSVSRKSIHSLLKIWLLRQVILQHQPDVLHVRSRMLAWLTYFTLQTIPAAQRPHLVSTIQGLYKVTRYSAIMTKAERVIAISDSVAKYIHKNYPECPVSSVVRIYRGIDMKRFPRDYQPSTSWQQMTFQLFPQVKDKVILTFPGRISPVKGHFYFLDVIATLKAQFNIHGVIIGASDEKDQAYLEQLNQQIIERGLQDNITFVGHRRDIRDWLASSSLVLSLATQPEKFGRTALEALALGCPVIGWNHGGVAEILQHSYPEGLVEPFQTHQLIAKVREMLSQPLKPQSLQGFSLQHMTDQVIGLYQDVIYG